MKVAFFTGFTTWKPHYETELEIIQAHLDAGDTVIQYHCNSDLSACDANLGHTRMRCQNCMDRRNRGMQLIEGNVVQRRYVQLTPADRRQIDHFRGLRFNSIDELKALRFHGFDIGYAVLSSLVSHLREPRPDLVVHGELVGKLLGSALAVHCSVRDHIAQEGIDRFYVFNGRFAILRAVLRACQEKGVECFTHERGCNLDHYSIYPNTLPHDLRYWRSAIERSWSEQQDTGLRATLAAKFFEDRAKGQVQSWYSFVKDQLPDELPEGFDPSVRNIVIFNSSEDEFAAIDSSHGNDVYVDQEQAIRQITKSVGELGAGYRLYLRSHPNLRTVHNSQTRFLDGFSSPALVMIPPSSTISTYALLKHADLVITFGSTMGIEAAYWGKPSVMVGSAFHAGLGAVYEPRTHEEVMRMVETGAEPLANEGALKYGHYMSTFGKPYQHYNQSGVVSGTFKGVPLDRDPMEGVDGRISRSLRWRMIQLRNAYNDHRGRIALQGVRSWLFSLVWSPG